MVVAALNLAAGTVVIRHPEGTAEALTMFAALLFLTGGVFRLAGSVVVRRPQFGWTLVQGAFGVLLGLIAIGTGGRQMVNLVSATTPDPHKVQKQSDS